MSNETFNENKQADILQQKLDQTLTILDDIDSLSDAIRPASELGYKAFYHAAMNLARKRHLFVDTCK